ncbi:ABC transporter ATP-binding protein [Eisenbergiella sp.]
MTQKLQHQFALSEGGARDMFKAFGACTLAYLVLMLPAGLLYRFVSDLMAGAVFTGGQAVFYAAGIALCLLLVYLTTGLQYKATFFATYKESGVRRVSLAEHLRKLPLSFFGRRDLTDLTNAIMDDCARIETASSHWIPELAGSILSTTLIAVSLFFFDWRLALASLWVLPVSFLIVAFSSRVQKALGRKNNDARLACADGIQECLETMRDLKSNNYEEQYMEGLREKIAHVEKRTILSELGAAAFCSSAQMFLKLGVATTALAGGALLAGGQIDIMTFFLFLMVVSRLYDPLQVALQNLLAILTLSVQTERMNEILETPFQTGAERLTNQGCDIVFDHVGFSYHETGEKVLDDVSFTAKQGEVTALIGPSGGGKTTVSRLAARFWDIEQGKITVGGMDISKVDPETLLSLYSIVFQDVTLFDNTILENIRIGKKNATDEEVMAAARLANCEEFVSKLPGGWDTRIGENGSELSGGERQRISIARAFLKDAPIILLDEATASLDVDNESLIQESLSRLIRNKTVLIIAHRMRTVANADKIVVLKDGRIIEGGMPAELLAQKGVYSHMCELQTQTQGWVME